MKHLYALTLIVSLVGCGSIEGQKETAQKRPVSIEPVAKVRAPATLELQKQPLSDLVGYWMLKKGRYANVIKIKDTYSSTRDVLTTKVYGIDLAPDFGYPSVANSDNDAPEIQINPDGNVREALLARDVNGSEYVFEITFQATGDELKVNITDGEKVVVQSYKRVNDWGAAERFMRKLQSGRTRRLLNSLLKTNGSRTCGEDGIRWMPLRDLVCIEKMLRDGRLSETDKLALMSRAAKEVALDTMRFLLKNGVDANAVLDANGSTALMLLFREGHLSYGVGQHGFVSTQLEKDEMVRTLLEAGATFDNPTPFSNDLILRAFDPKIVHMVIDRIKDTEYVKKQEMLLKATTALFLAGYRDRWASQAPKLLEKLVKAGALDSSRYLSSESALTFSVTHGDEEALKILFGQMAGAVKKQKALNLIHDGEEQIRVERANLKSAHFSAYWDQLEIARKIDRIEKNIAYLKTLK